MTAFHAKNTEAATKIFIFLIQNCKLNKVYINIFYITYFEKAEYTAQMEKALEELGISANQYKEILRTENQERYYKFIYYLLIIKELKTNKEIRNIYSILVKNTLCAIMHKKKEELVTRMINN